MELKNGDLEEERNILNISICTLQNYVRLCMDRTWHGNSKGNQNMTLQYWYNSVTISIQNINVQMWKHGKVSPVAGSYLTICRVERVFFMKNFNNKLNWNILNTFQSSVITFLYTFGMKDNCGFHKEDFQNLRFQKYGSTLLQSMSKWILLQNFLALELIFYFCTLSKRSST